MALWTGSPLSDIPGAKLNGIIINYPSERTAITSVNHSNDYSLNYVSAITVEMRVPAERVVSIVEPGGTEAAEVTAWPSTRVME